MMSKIKILFIGNSHTYYNDMPLIAKDIFASAGIEAEITMLTQGGKCLDWHYEQKQTRFNILYGGYDTQAGGFSSVLSLIVVAAIIAAVALLLMYLRLTMRAMP